MSKRLGKYNTATIRFHIHCVRFFHRHVGADNGLPCGGLLGGKLELELVGAVGIDFDNQLALGVVSGGKKLFVDIVEKVA